MKTNFKVIDLFCGGGGLSQGLADAGMNIVAAFDNWDPALDFYKKNIPDHHVAKLDLTNSEVVSSKLHEFDFNMIVGGPPCQDFSSAGKRDEKGRRANLTISFAEVISKLQPDFFIMENVDRAQKTQTFAKALSIFQNSGYGITAAVLDASLCGVPQKRKRVIVFGALGDGNNSVIAIIRNKQANQPMTLRDYFGNDFGIQYYYRHPRSYARRAIFSIDEPSPTIRGVNRPVPQGYPGHPGDATPLSDKIRPLTTRERSLIQTFPPNWFLEGNKSDIEQIIGNAVPVKLGEFIGCCLTESISNKKSLINRNINGKNPCKLFVQRAVYPHVKRKRGTGQEIHHPASELLPFPVE